MGRQAPRQTACSTRLPPSPAGSCTAPRVLKQVDKNCPFWRKERGQGQFHNIWKKLYFQKKCKIMKREKVTNLAGSAKLEGRAQLMRQQLLLPKSCLIFMHFMT